MEGKEEQFEKQKEEIRILNLIVEYHQSNQNKPMSGKFYDVFLLGREDLKSSLKKLYEEERQNAQFMSGFNSQEYIDGFKEGVLKALELIETVKI
jgi:hypothetical protein